MGLLLIDYKFYKIFPKNENSFLFIIIVTLKILILTCSHSVLPKALHLPSYNTSCTDILCIHGKCVGGRCLCDKGWQGSSCHKCGGRLKLTEPSGYITDGMKNYSKEIQCAWLIDSQKPDAIIRLKFVEFETECAWDHLYIFDGYSVFSPLIAAFSGLIIKSNQKYLDIPEIVATSGRAYLYFYSDAEYYMSGFNISYSIDSCPNNCSSHGACIGGYCTCSGKWDGPSCSIPICPNNCGNHGHCDKEKRRCICDSGYTGNDCSHLQLGPYWVNLYVDEIIQGRALHKSLILENVLYITGGLIFSKFKKLSNFLIKYNFVSNSWTTFQSYTQPSSRYSHSLVGWNTKLYLYGGILDNGTVVNEFWSYNTLSDEWKIIDNTYYGKNCEDGLCAPIATHGHTANIVGGKMIVIFGHNPLMGYLNTVQEYDFVSDIWKIVETNGAVVKGGYGHTSVYHDSSKAIYVYGGHHSQIGKAESILVDYLYAYYPSLKSWKLYNPSQSPRYLHSAVIFRNYILIYGGNRNIGNTSHYNIKDKCFSSSLLLYNIDCDTWSIFSDTYTNKNSDPLYLGRYGHTAHQYKNEMYVFGGFNGIMLNSFIKFIPEECWKYEEDECAKTKLICEWNESLRLCQSLKKFKHKEIESILDNSLSRELNRNQCEPRKSNFTEICKNLKSCSSCQENSYGCVWCGEKDQCRFEKCQRSKNNLKELSNLHCLNDVSSSECPTLHNCHSCYTGKSCHWKQGGENINCIFDIKVGNKTTSLMNENRREMLLNKCFSPCESRKTCLNCTHGPYACMWCASSQRCIESNSYAAVFPIAQCSQWTTDHDKCSGMSCSDIKVCNECLKRPSCGWCDNGTGTGVGRCSEGSEKSPYVWKEGQYIEKKGLCLTNNWHFNECPLCQCNGHSKCNLENKCYKCDNHTIGDNCQHCEKGYYGDPKNGGNCSPCFCNNHSDVCNKTTGICNCITKGIVGHHCDKCDEQNHYFGNPAKENGSCYYNLTIDFQYTFNMSKPDDKHFTRINFMNMPIKPDVDVDFSITCSEESYVNITLGSSSFPERKLYNGHKCGSFKLRFSHEENLFGIDNSTFYVNVYGFRTPFLIQISFSQHRTLDLLQFFVTFSTCFLTLLIIAAIFWKIKQKYDTYRRRQQLFLELEHMASRPFAAIATDIGFSENTQSSSNKNNPTPIALEPLNCGKAAVISLLIRFPTNSSGTTLSGRTGLTIASALVSLGNMDQKYSKDNESFNASLNASKTLTNS